MSRSGFDECDYDDGPEAILAIGRVRGWVASAKRGKRGQSFLKMALEVLDAMEDKRLAARTFGARDGCMCLMTTVATEVGKASALSQGDGGEGTCHSLAAAFDVAPSLIQDLVWDNDYAPTCDPAERWRLMRNSIAKDIRPPVHERREGA